jgi:hypothetical protein
MIKYIKNLEDQTHSVLAEDVAKDAAEVSGLDPDIVSDAVAGLNFASYLELGNAISNQDGELVRELLNISDVVPEEPIEEDIFDEDKLLNKPTPTLKDLAKKHDRSLAAMGSQLAKGIKAEKEHTTDMLVAKEIALDHLNELPDYYDRLEKMEEADNPSAPAKATPTQPAVTPPSAGSSIDALAQPADTAVDKDNQEVQQGRKEIDDLQIGDEVEVADIDGQPAAGRVRNTRGPGDTLVITGKGNEEHMIRKDSILSTPMIDVQEKKQSRLDKTWLGKKNKRAERVENKKKKDVQEELWPGQEEEDARLSALAIEEFGPEGFKRHPNWPAGTVLLAHSDQRKAARAKFKQEGWEKEYPTDKRDKWFVHPNKPIKAAIDYEAGVTYVTTALNESSRIEELRANFEKVLNEVAPPGMEDWIKKRKPEFKDRYGDRWEEVLYATAWKQHNNESVEEDFQQEETYDEMVEYWQQSLSSSIVSKGVFTQLYDAAGQDIDVLNSAIKDQAYSIADSYHGSGEGIGSSDQNHFIYNIAQSLGIDDIFGWNKSKIASDEEMERDKTNRAAKYGKAIRAEGLEEGTGFHFFVDPLEVGANVMSSNGDIHDYYDTEEEALAVAKDLNAQYGQVDEDISRIRELAGIKETASGGATGAGAIASAPVAMNGMQSRNPSIYGQTKLKKKPTPKKRPTKEDTSAGIGRSKKA